MKLEKIVKQEKSLLCLLFVYISGVCSKDAMNYLNFEQFDDHLISG